jgi:hypothetical protein
VTATCVNDLVGSVRHHAVVLLAQGSSLAATFRSRISTDMAVGA